MVATSGAEARVLQRIRRTTRATRAELAQGTGLSRAAVNQAVSALVARHLVVSTTLAPSLGGRRPSLLRFNHDAGYVLAIDLGATSVDIAVTDLAARPVASQSLPIDVRHGPAQVLPDIKQLATQLLASLNVPSTRILAIGMGVPGPIEYRSGRPVSPPIMPGWDGLALREMFQPEFHCPVYVDNDVNIMAIGEQWAGCGRGVDNFLFIKVGTGIGSGIISGGALHRGADGSAGDIGHIEAVPDGPLCHCGNRGCLEAVVGGPAIARLAEEAARDGSSPMLAERLAQRNALSARDVGEAAAHGDQAALNIVRVSGQTLGHVVAGLVNFFNPSLVVIGGGVLGIGDLFLSTVRETVYRRSLPLSTRQLTIQRTTLGNAAGVVGASILAIEELFAANALNEAAA